MTYPLSVIIPCFNAEKHVPGFLSAIRPDIDIEYIFIDDGSTDNTYNLLSDRRVIKNPLNLGTHKSRFAGIKYATREYVMFQDIDDPFNYDSLDYLMEERKKYGHDTLLPVPKRITGTDIVWNMESYDNPFQYLISELNSLCGRVSIHNTPIHTFTAIAGFNLMNRSLFDAGIDRIDVCEDMFLFDTMIIYGLIKHVLPLNNIFAWYNQNSGTNISRNMEKRVKNIPIALAQIWYFLHRNGFLEEDAGDRLNALVNRVYKENADKFMKNLLEAHGKL